MSTSEVSKPHISPEQCAEETRYVLAELMGGAMGLRTQGMNGAAELIEESVAYMTDFVDRLVEQLETLGEKCNELTGRNQFLSTEQVRADVLQEQLEALQEDHVLRASHDEIVGRMEREVREADEDRNHVHARNLKLEEQLEAQAEHIRRAQACLDDALAFSNPAISRDNEQTREQLLERLALTVKEAVWGGSFDGTLFESQVNGTLWLLYGERSPASRPTGHEPWCTAENRCCEDGPLVYPKVDEA